jgi:hypothetical protein
MYSLTVEQTQSISGGDLVGLAGAIFGAGGVYYGLGLGVAMAALPAFAVGTAIALAYEAPVLAVCTGATIISLGGLGGAFAGGKFGNYVGTEIAEIAQTTTA